MAIRSILYSTPNVFPAQACQEVRVCLADGWEAETVSGTRWITATLGDSIRNLGGIASVAGMSFNARGQDLVQYQLDIDDTQFSDPDNAFPTCADIESVSPLTCDWAVPA